jgi:hypothetical protein
VAGRLPPSEAGRYLLLRGFDEFLLLTEARSFFQELLEFFLFAMDTHSFFKSAFPEMDTRR